MRMNPPRRHACSVKVPQYLPVKRAMISAGLLSCSEQGFVVAMGPLVELRAALTDWLARLEEVDERWEVPALIRADWVPRGVWREPAEDLWCSEQPGGHLLTPRPLFHLLNRLRHHPVEGGAWLLGGQCTRDERDTLPMLRQRVFTMMEYVVLAPQKALSIWLAGLLERLWEQAVAWDLPVDLSATDDRCSGMDLRLRLTDEQPLRLARGWELPVDVSSAYGLQDQRLAIVGCGIERWCLAILARHGVEADSWRRLPGLYATD